MIQWFKNLSEGWQIAIFGAAVTVGLLVVGGVFKLFKWLSGRKKDPDLALEIIDGTLKENKQLRQTVKQLEEQLSQPQIMADTARQQDRYETTLKQLGQSKEKIKNQQETIRQLEEQLSQPQVLADAGRQQVPQLTQQAKDIAARIEDDAGPYALALKAIAGGNIKKANELLDKTQQFLDKVQERQEEAQAKIYMARMQNASYAGKPKDALQYCDKLTTLAGNDSLIMNEMAAIYFENAKYEEAEPLIQRALAIDEKSFGKDHPKVARDLNNLAQLYQATNRLKEAEPLMERALKIVEKSFGKDHPNVAICLNNLALLYQATNRLKEAEPLMERALKIDEKSFGKDHPNIAIELNNLAQLYQDTNRFKEAEPVMERALKIDEASLGPEHPKVAIRLNNLAVLYQDTNRLEEAEPLMERALKIDEASLGKDHPKVAIRLNNLARLYQATNRLKEAEPLMERHLLIFLQFTRRTGHRHPHLEDAINNYGSLLMKMGYSKDEVAAKLKRLAPEMFD